MGISKDIFSIRVGYISDPALSIRMRGVESIKLVGEGRAYVPNALANPRIIIETQDGMFVFYRDDLQAILLIGKKEKKHGEVSFPPESHIDLEGILQTFRQSRKQS